jgi:ubiquinone/menaquinone biosynthesis C-methylase UbiE
VSATPFASPAEHYDRFMGRYSANLAPLLADAAGVAAGDRVLDVGCGPGSLTSVLVARLGADHVAAIDPAPQFAAACRERHPGADVRQGGAEELPWADGTFDAALACLVIAFMRDPEQGLREMVRVVRPGGTVATCMWDVPGGGMTMLSTFWKAAREIDPGAEGEHMLPGMAKGDLGERFRAAGLDDVVESTLETGAAYTGFDDFWEPFTLAVGPAGAYLRKQPAERQEAIRERLRSTLPDGPFELPALAWFARGTVPG